MWRRLSLEERFRIVAAMIEDGFALLAASIRAAHPEYTPEAAGIGVGQASRRSVAQYVSRNRTSDFLDAALGSQ